MDIIKKILIAVDEASTSEKVVLYAKNLAQQLNAEIALISAVDTEFMITEGYINQVDLTEMQEESLNKSHRLLIYKLFHNQEIKSFVKRGEPRDIILKTAEEWNADLIVIGTHSRTGLSHFLIGSVAESVIKHSTKPVLVIPIK